MLPVFVVSALFALPLCVLAAFPITGATGSVEPRLEIRTMATQHPNQFNLYLLALRRWMNMSQSEMLSYYQVGGIHGVPNIPWDGVSGNPKSGGAVGYCTHNSVLFPAWHRAYMGLFEQVLQTQVNAVVQEFPASQRATWQSAASTWRIPFWDWAAAPPNGGPTMPIEITNPTVTVTTPTGRKTIPNPLYKYHYDPLSASDLLRAPWNTWHGTRRWPSSTQSDATSQDNLAVNAIENSRLNHRDSLYQLFTLCSDYLEFSNDAASSSTSGCHTSIEAIHNSIHSLTGGSNDGTMTWLWWAAHDPVFWLHHANVDRIFALWQAVYPNSYGANQVSTGNTFTINTGSLQGANSPLTPFHSNSDGSFWTSNGVRDWRIFHYTYPEFVNTDGSSSSIRGVINDLYGPSATATAGSEKRGLIHKIEKGLNGTLSSGSDSWQYFSNVVTRRFGLNGTYTIYLFLGEPEESPADYPFASNLIGSISSLAQIGMKDMGQMTSGAVPLTRVLHAKKDSGFIESLDKLIIVPLLQKLLVWKVVGANNNLVDNDAVPGLEVSVVSGQVKAGKSKYDFPTFSGFTTLPDVTDGKAGGLKVGNSAACG